MTQDKIDEAFLDDPEEDLWEHLNEYVWEDLPTDERVTYVKTIYTLVEKFGHSYGEILQRTGWSESAGGLAKRVRKILGSGTASLERKATKIAKKQISDIITKKVAQEVITNNELGDWLSRTYGPIADFMGIPTDQLVAQAMNYYIFERQKQEKLVEDLMEDDYNKTILLNELVEAASPNFVFREKMKWINQMIEFTILMQANGIELPPAFLSNYIKLMDVVEQGY